MVRSGPINEQEFKLALNRLIVQASRNDVSIVNGGYVFRHDSAEIPDVEVMIYRLAEARADGG
jgi:hypothetical protein